MIWWDSFKARVEKGFKDPDCPQHLTYWQAKRLIVRNLQRAYFGAALQAEGGNVTAAAHRSNIQRTALQRHLRALNIRSEEYRAKRSATLLCGHRYGTMGTHCDLPPGEHDDSISHDFFPREAAA